MRRVLSDGFLVSGTINAGDTTVIKVALMGSNGKAKVIVGEAAGDERICRVSSAARLGDDIAVVDDNCRSLLVWKRDGAFVGKIDVEALTGLRLVPLVLETGRDDAYLIGSVEDHKDRYVGVIIRLVGY